MCRLYGFLANQPTKVECTLVHAQNALLHQSRSDLTGLSHTDGWGISCYPNGIPLRERRAMAAHEDLWFSTTAERTYSHAVVAHIRRATVGGPRLENTHPFLSHRWTFAHNGTLSNFEALESHLAEETHSGLLSTRGGSTDSELIFLWLLSRFQDSGISIDGLCDCSDHLIDVIADSLRLLREKSKSNLWREASQFNFILTDGQILIATCWNHTLHYVTRIGLHDCEICGIPHVSSDSKDEYRACIIASEPISDESWKAVANYTILLVDQSVELHSYPVA